MFFSRKAYRVERMGLAGLRYTEGPRKMIIDSEVRMGPDVDIVIFAGSIVRWEAPYDTEEVTDADKRRIRANIAEGLGRLKIEWDPKGSYVGPDD